MKKNKSKQYKINQNKSLQNCRLLIITIPNITMVNYVLLIGIIHTILFLRD